MKVNQIVSEHKKGVRAKKYAKKPKKYIEPIKPQGPVGPEGAEDAKKKINELDSTMSQGKITANDGKTITVAMPDGTQIQKPIVNAVSQDEQGNPVFNVMSTQTGPAGQPQQDPAQQIAQGKNIEVNTGAPVEEDSTTPAFGSPEWIEAVKNGTIKLQAAQMPTDNRKAPPNPAEDEYQKKVDAAMRAREKTNPYKPVPMPIMKESDKALLDKMLTIAGLK